MADQPTQYAQIAGIVQQFGADKPVVTEREVSGQTLREFTVKSLTSGKLVRISLWPEFGDVEIERGTLITADGRYSTSVGDSGREFYNLTPNTLNVVPPVEKAQREVVNRQDDEPSEEAPF